MESWIPVANDSDFSIHNLPFGIFSTTDRSPRAGIAIGEQIVDLAGLVEAGLMDIPLNCVRQERLNDFIRLGKKTTSSVRRIAQGLLSRPDSALKSHPRILVKQVDATMHLPVEIGDYTDFYSSLEHATNVGKMFRDPENALLPNWKHLPVGYHGRASSIVISGTPIHRPLGQVLPPGATQPVFRATQRLDFELEMAFVIGRDSALGQRISTQEAEDYIFGKVLFNDWSARDIQKWEYVPLGPFLGKSFASSISPWIVTMDALLPFRVPGPRQDPPVLPYLQYAGEKNYDIDLEVAVQPPRTTEQTVCRSNFKHLYWNMAQQVAHHTAAGCNLRVGDLMASGTISGRDETAYGSMLELSWSGTKSLPMADGSSRTFIEDGDTVVMRGYAEKNSIRVGFGEVRNQILPPL